MKYHVPTGLVFRRRRAVFVLLAMPPTSQEGGGIAKRLFFMFFVLVFLGIYPLKRFLFLLGYGELVGVGEEGEAAREAEKQ